jgi:hypothetical protein
VRDLQHVECLLLGLDGVDNVGRLVTDLGVILRSNGAALVGIDEEVKGVASTLEAVHGDTIDHFSRQDGRHCDILDRLSKLDHVAELLLLKVDTQAACDVRLEDVLEALKAVSVQRPTIGAPLASTASASFNYSSDGAASSDSGWNFKPNSDAPVLDYDDMNVRFAQVNPKLDRLLIAVQKGRAPAGEKSEIAQLIRHLFEPWKVDPARVSYRLDKEIGAGGFGRVYKGKLGTASVAVKVINAALLSADVSLKADFCARRRCSQNCATRASSSFAGHTGRMLWHRSILTRAVPTAARIVMRKRNVGREVPSAEIRVLTRRVHLS